MNNKFSVLMSLYIKENPNFLNECLDSLSKQTVRASEVILVFDGPITKELEIVVGAWKEELNIEIVPLEENLGLGKALNIGLTKCNFELVARMDTDDLCLPTRFEKQLKCFSDNPDLAIVGSFIEEVEPLTLKKISLRKVPLSHQDIVRELPRKNPFNHMTVMYRKAAIIEAGGYKHLPFMEDWFLWLRLLGSNMKGQNLSEVTVRARTGREMLVRRSGWNYIRSEFLMARNMFDSGMVSLLRCASIFILRASPRLLPKFIMRVLYRYSR